jgi:hypothetical protein
MAGQGFFTYFSEGGEVFFYGRDICWGECKGDSSGFISHHEEEWGGVTSTVLVGVVDEFSKGEVLGPFSRGRTAIDAEVGFEFLVKMFSLSVCLWVIGGRQCDFVAQETSEFFCELRGELGTMIRDEFIMQAEA